MEDVEKFKIEYLSKSCVLKETSVEASSAFEARKAVAKLSDCDSVVSCEVEEE